MSQADPKPVRCAIYTRKSTDENIELDFNSLDAQRESAEAYIASQKGAGWACRTATTTRASQARRWTGPPSSG